MVTEITGIKGGAMDAHGMVIQIDLQRADGTIETLKLHHSLMPHLARNIQQLNDLAEKMRRKFKEDVQFVTVTPYVASDVDAAIYENRVVVKYKTADTFPLLVAMPEQVARLCAQSIQVALTHYRSPKA